MSLMGLVMACSGVDLLSQLIIQIERADRFTPLLVKFQRFGLVDFFRKASSVLLDRS